MVFQSGLKLLGSMSGREYNEHRSEAYMGYVSEEQNCRRMNGASQEAELADDCFDGGPLSVALFWHHHSDLITWLSLEVGYAGK